MTRRIVLKLACFVAAIWWSQMHLLAADPKLASLNDVVVNAELKTVKLYGAGGGGLDAYQSGCVISAEGHILTAWSTVLDVDEILAVSSDGWRTEATVIGIDPNLEFAVLKASDPPEKFFDWSQTRSAVEGQRVLAVSNLYGIATGTEMSSVQKGLVMAKTELNARRGAFESVYQGPVLIIDAMTNNPGAAGGALVDLNGNFVGLLGKELRDAQVGIWLNYALPYEAMRESVERLMQGKSVARLDTTRPPADRPATLNGLGLVLVPNVLSKTPAYVDLVQPNSPASRAAVESDDLILFVNSLRVASQSMLFEELKHIDRADPIIMLIQRGRELKEVTLTP